MAKFKEPEQPPIGGFCETCGHFAGRHGEEGCLFPGGCKAGCEVMVWQGEAWPRPWLPFPDGMERVA
jgi:hypothetical protein